MNRRLQAIEWTLTVSPDIQFPDRSVEHMREIQDVSELSSSPGISGGPFEASPKKSLVEHISAAHITRSSLFSFHGYDWSQLSAMCWPLPTVEDVDRVQRRESDYNTKMMDTFGRVFQDSCFSLRSAWEGFQPSDEISPPLFLSLQDLKCLEDEFNKTNPPSLIFKQSAVYERSWIMEKFHEVDSIKSQEVGITSGRFCLKPSYFLFFLRFGYPVQVMGDPEISAITIEKQYWTTVKFSPGESSLEMFVPLVHKPSFDSNKEVNLALLNSVLRIIYNYWDVQPHSFSSDDINLIENPLTNIDCASGAVNAMYLFSAINGDTSNQIQVVSKNPQKLQDCLDEVLMYTLGLKSPPLKRKGMDFDGTNKRRRLV